MSTIKRQPHEQRVVDEKAQNDERLAKLKPFMETEAFKALDSTQRDLLSTQASLMEALSTVLGLRIERFPLDPYGYHESHRMIDAGGSMGGQCCEACSAVPGTRRAHNPCRNSLLTGARAQ